MSNQSAREMPKLSPSEPNRPPSDEEEESEANDPLILSQSQFRNEQASSAVDHVSTYNFYRSTKTSFLYLYEIIFFKIGNCC